MKTEEIVGADEVFDALLDGRELTADGGDVKMQIKGGLLPLMAIDDDADVVKMYSDANIPSFLPPNVPTVLI